MSFIAIADVHLEHKLYNIPALEQDLFDMFENCVTLAIEKKPKHLIIVGDLVDTNQPRPSTIEFIRKQVIRLSDHNIGVLGIAGDHDRPIEGRTWRDVCHIHPVDAYPDYAGIDFCDPAKVFNYLRNRRERSAVQWIFLHGQDTGLFEISKDEQKKLNFNDIDLFELYPNLRGIVLGDIHSPLSRTLKRDGRHIDISYCGSLGIVKADEAHNKRGVLCYDDTVLYRLPLPQPRDFICMSMSGATCDEALIAPYKIQYPEGTAKKPVFRVEITELNEKLSAILSDLNKYGFVQRIQYKVNNKGEKIESLTRSELSLNNKINDVFKSCCKRTEAYELGIALLAAEPEGTIKAVLDKFIQTNVPFSSIMRETRTSTTTEL